MKRDYFLMVFITLLVLFIRLYFAFQTPYFAEDGYLAVRQVEHTAEHGYPMIYDELSYGGRTHVFAPLFYYILAFFELLLPLGIVGKLLPNIFAALLVPLIYYLAKELTDDSSSALFSSFIAGFIPVFFSNINSISAYSLIVLLVFYMIYCFMKIEEGAGSAGGCTEEKKYTAKYTGKYTYYFIIAFLAAALTSSIIIVLLISLMGYLVLIKLENFKIEKKETELIFFSLFLFLWLQMLIFKKALFFHGIGVIWQNIPQQILENYFAGTSIISAVYKIGIIPVLYGIYAVYHYIYNEKDRKVYLLLAMAFTAAVLLWLKFIQTEIGLMLLGAAMAVLFSKFYKYTFDYIKTTRLSRLHIVIWAVFMAVFIFSSVLPSISFAAGAAENSVSNDDYKALEWIKDNTPEDSVIAALPMEGHLINAVALRKNIADSDYLLIGNINRRFNDANGIFSAYFDTEVIKTMEKYNSKYLFFSENARKQLGIENLKFVDETKEKEKCFRAVYSKKAAVYEMLCRLNTNGG